MNAPEPSAGVGDTVEKGIKKVTFGLVPTCPGCKKRQEWLNKHFPYEKRVELGQKAIEEGKGGGIGRAI